MRLIEFLTHYQEFAIFILLGKSLKNWTNKKIKNSQTIGSQRLLQNNNKDGQRVCSVW